MVALQGRCCWSYAMDPHVRGTDRPFLVANSVAAGIARAATKLLAVAGRRCATRRWLLLEVCCDDQNFPGATGLGIFRGQPDLAFAGGCYQTVVFCWRLLPEKLLNGPTKALCDQTLAVAGSLLR